MVKGGDVMVLLIPPEKGAKAMIDKAIHVRSANNKRDEGVL
jgi:hypothetical protein